MANFRYYYLNVDNILDIAHFVETNIPKWYLSKWLETTFEEYAREFQKELSHVGIKCWQLNFLLPLA